MFVQPEQATGTAVEQEAAKPNGGAGLYAQGSPRRPISCRARFIDFPSW
jgi:hypothetical protein